MSRTRSTTAVFPRSMSDFDPTIYDYHYGFADEGYTTGYSTISSITDDNADPQQRYVKACSHERAYGSLISSVHDFGRYNVFWQNEFMGSSSVKLNISVIPTAGIQHADNVDWASLLSGLADTVKLRNQTKSQLLVTLAELSKTVRMVRNPFNLLKSDWRQTVGILTAGTLARKAKKLSSIWLEGRYGWNSALVDIRNFSVSAANYINRHPTSSQGKIGERLSRSQVVQSAAPYSSLKNQNICDWYFRHNQQENEDFIPYAQVGSGGCVFVNIVTVGDVQTTANLFCTRGVPSFQDVAATGIERFMQYFGCTARDILPTLWELTPYSFVVDWFINARALAAFPDYVFLEGEHLYNVGSSLKTTWNYKAQAVPLCQDTRYYAGWKMSNRKAEGNGGSKTLYTRTAGFPAPEILMVNKGLSLTHLADAAGLIIQRLIK